MAEFKIAVKDKIIQFEIESARSMGVSVCNFCDYYGMNLKDPEVLVLESHYISFSDFCKDRLKRNDKPAKGTPETNLLQIFSDEALVKLKRPQQPTPLASINDYCEKVCIISCVKIVSPCI